MSAPLELNCTGPAVFALQHALLAKGFDPHGQDGCFGLATEAAVKSFQATQGLPADGVVGAETAQALGLEMWAQTEPAPAAGSHLPCVTAHVTAAMVCRMFPQTPLANIQANLPAVLGALEKVGLADKTMILMALGTIRAETGSFRPISEGVCPENTSPGGHPFDLYDSRTELGNLGAPDGANFCGRGFVQLTGRANYAFYGAKVGQDLVGNPRLANDPAIASDLLAYFLFEKEARIRTALQNPDQATGLKAARRLVNGGSNGLAEFTSAYRIGVELIP